VAHGPVILATQEERSGRSLEASPG
jgi:hypothetical protein